MKSAVAVIALVPGDHMLGQSVGCVVPLSGSIPLGFVSTICARLAEKGGCECVSVNLIGQGEVANHCLSVSFHFPICGRPVDAETLSRRARALKKWVSEEFRVQTFEERAFPDRAAFCTFIEDPRYVR